MKSIQRVFGQFKALALMMVFFSFSIYGNVKINDVTFAQDNRGGRILFQFSKEVIDPPVLIVKGSLIQLDFLNVKSWQKIEKWVGLKNEVKISSLGQGRSNTRVKIIFPYSMMKHKDLISVTMKSNSIRLNFPYKKSFHVKKKNAIVVKKKINKKNIAKKKLKGVKIPLDEKYLEQLIVSNKKDSAAVKFKPEAIKEKDVEKTFKQVPERDKGGEFNFNSYIVKFIVFLTMIIIGFLLMVKIFKKGALGKSKLNLFSADPALIKVINTTYIAPKKSLMLIRVHEQLLLVSNSDNGINFLTEIKDQIGALKSGDSAVNGSNFDEIINDSKDKEVALTEKKDIYESKTKFTDEIKRKFKSLKPLQ